MLYATTIIPSKYVIYIMLQYISYNYQFIQPLYSMQI